MKERYTSYLRCVRCGRMVKGSDLLKNSTRVSNSVRFFDIMADKPVPDMNSKYFLCPNCMTDLMTWLELDTGEIRKFEFDVMSIFTEPVKLIYPEPKEEEEEGEENGSVE